MFAIVLDAYNDDALVFNRLVPSKGQYRLRVNLLLAKTLCGRNLQCRQLWRILQRHSGSEHKFYGQLVVT